MKFILSLLSVALLLTSCGSETTKPTQDPAYDYVEIEECIIPIPTRYHETTSDSNKRPYLYHYLYEEKKQMLNNQYIITVKKRYEDDYTNMKEFIAQGKNRTIVSETKRVNFKILEATIYDDTLYYLYGKKSIIHLMPSNKRELNYLLNYCKKTWKLNKGEKNASTPK